MEFFPSTLSPEESDQAIARVERDFDLHGFSFYAAEFTETQTFIGFVGISIPSFDAPFMPGPFDVSEDWAAAAPAVRAAIAAAARM